MPPDLEPWMTSAAGPFVTIRAGGPLDAVATLTANTSNHRSALGRRDKC